MRRIALEYGSYRSDISAMWQRLERAEAGDEPLLRQVELTAEAGGVAARALSHLLDEDALWRTLAEADEGATRGLPVEEFLPFLSSEVLDQLGWSPPPPSGEVAARARGALLDQPDELSAEARRDLLRRHRDLIAGLTTALEAKAQRLRGESEGAGEPPDVRTAERTRLDMKRLGRRIRQVASDIAIAITIFGAFPSDAGTEPPPLDPPAIEQQQWAWLRSFDAMLLQAQADDDAVARLYAIAFFAQTDPDVALWLALVHHDEDALKRALERGADPNSTLRDVVGRYFANR